MSLGIARKIERRLGLLAATSHRHPWIALAIALVTAAAGAYFARSIQLNSDLTSLLPKSFESVQGLERLKEHFGGLGYVVVVGMDASAEQLRAFADDVAPKIDQLEDIRWVQHRHDSEFFNDHALYYLELEDLEDVRDRVEARAAWERQSKNPLFVDLEDEGPPSVDVSDLEEKYRARSHQRIGGVRSGYYLDEQRRMIVLLAKPSASAADLAYARKLTDAVREVVASQDLSKYGPDFRFELTGTFQKKLDQTQQIASDIGAASMLALLLMLGYLLLHFRNVAAVLLVLLPVGTGISWTYGIVGATYGSMSLLTGFLGAVLGGLGTEHGIHLLGRYRSLREDGVEEREAICDAFAHTGSAALVSALVAALTFLSVAVSEFAAFREFGVIAALGMILVILAYILVLPAALAVVLKLKLWSPPKPRLSPARSAIARWIAARPRLITLTAAAILAGLILDIGRAWFDYDFAALEDSSLPSFQLDREVNRILGHSQTPVVLITTPDAERAVVAELRARQQQLGEASTIDFVSALEDLVPQQQQDKREILQEIAATLGKVDPSKLDAKTKERFDQLSRASASAPFSRADLPLEIRRQFDGVGDSDRGFVLVFPRISLADGERVRALAKEVRDIPLPSGEIVSASGEPMVLADVLEMVTRESPIVVGAALISVLLAMWIALGSLRTALLCLAPTVLSILGLAGLMPLLGLPFNYLNIVTIPVLIGVTVDAGVHLLSRLSEGRESFERVYAETGRAIVGGLLTSAFGFGSLVLADHPGLASVGRLAVLGLGVNLMVMLLAFPAAFLWLQWRDVTRAIQESASGAPGRPPTPPPTHHP